MSPRVVAIGGGHGLAASLRAARRYAGAVTGIVAVADDGGSSGRLRQSLGVPPPGDLRKCLVALADDGLAVTRAFEHRFGAGELEGHALGNLVLAGLWEETGDLIAAVDEAARILGVTGRVLPATCETVVLKGDVGGQAVEGQVALQNSGAIRRISLVPADPAAPPDALEALATADQVVIGPGSLYTSVLAAAVVPALRDAIAVTTGRVVYVCNLRPQEPETAGHTVADHVEALAAHDVRVDVALVHQPLAGMALGDVTVPVHAADLARPNGLAHDPEKLAAALADLVG